MKIKSLSKWFENSKIHFWQSFLKSVPWTNQKMYAIHENFLGSIKGIFESFAIKISFYRSIKRRKLKKKFFIQQKLHISCCGRENVIFAESLDLSVQIRLLQKTSRIPLKCKYFKRACDAIYYYSGAAEYKKGSLSRAPNTEVYTKSKKNTNRYWGPRGTWRFPDFVFLFFFFYGNDDTKVRRDSQYYVIYLRSFFYHFKKFPFFFVVVKILFIGVFCSKKTNLFCLYCFCNWLESFSSTSAVEGILMTVIYSKFLSDQSIFRRNFFCFVEVKSIGNTN